MFATVWPMSPQACWTTPRVTCGCSSYRSFGHCVFSTLMPGSKGLFAHSDSWIILKYSQELSGNYSHRCFFIFLTLKNNLVNFKDTTAKKFSRDQIKFQKYHKTQSTKMQESEITFRGTSRKTENRDEAIVLRPQLFRRKSSPVDTRIIAEITRREVGVGVYNWGPSNRSRRNWTMESRRCR